MSFGVGDGCHRPPPGSCNPPAHQLHKIKPVLDHPWMAPVNPQSPVPMIGAHCAAPHVYPITASPAGHEILAHAPPPPPPVRRKLRCHVVMLPGAICNPVILFGAIFSPLTNPLVTYPCGVTFRIPHTGHPRAPVSTRIHPVLRITFTAP